MLVALIVAVLAMKVVDHDTSRLPDLLGQVSAPLFAMAAIAYPLVDTLRIFVYRTMKGASPFAADRNHIHHRLMDLGLGHRGTSLVLYGYALLIIILSLLTHHMRPTVGLLGLGLFAFLLAVLPYFIPKRRSS